jgi:glycogen(starch) synthase
MRVLHLLDPAVLRQTDYRSRALAFIGALRAQGVQTVQLAGPCPPSPASLPASSSSTQADGLGGQAPGWHVYRTPAPAAPSRSARPCATGAPALFAALHVAHSAALLALRLRQVARLTRPDLIHVHAPGSHAPVWQAAASLAAGGRRPLPLVAEAERRGFSRDGWPALERWALARAAALAASSLEMRAALRGAGVACRRIAVIPPATGLAGLAGPARCERQPPGLEGAPLIAFAGRLGRSGGIDLLLSVLGLLRRRHPGLRLLVAGGGLREDELAQRIGASHARGYVVITGAMPARRIADLLPRADIALFPALAGHAGLSAPSRHLLDAMAQGCTIVASDIGCHRELLVHGHTAMLFQAGSRKALAAVLLGLLERPERRRALGMAAASHAAACHSWPATAAGYRRLYQHVLADQRR